MNINHTALLRKTFCHGLINTDHGLELSTREEIVSNRNRRNTNFQLGKKYKSCVHLNFISLHVVLVVVIGSAKSSLFEALYNNYTAEWTRASWRE